MEKSKLMGKTKEIDKDEVVDKGNFIDGCQECCHHKSTPRQDKELKGLQNRLKRMIGQLGGISTMLDENRYCGDILIQIAAVESALQSFGYLVLKEHMESCVVEEIQKGNLGVMEETLELMKKLK